MKNHSEDPFFVVGSPRSGTTLLVQLLNRHSRLFIPPETAFFHAKHQHEARFRSENREDMLRAFVDFFLSRRAIRLFALDDPNLRPMLLDGAADYCDVLSNFMRYLMDSESGRRWGEKSPVHLNYVPEILNCYPEAKILAIVRDGRAVVASRINHPNWNDNLYSASRIWRRHARTLRELRECYDRSRLHVLRYEDLLQQPKNELLAATEFLGEPFEQNMLGAGGGTESGKFDRYYDQDWMRKSRAPIDSRRIAAWADNFNNNQIACVEKQLSSELTFFGYSLTGAASSWWPLLLGRDFLVFLVRKLVRRFNPRGY